MDEHDWYRPADSTRTRDLAAIVLADERAATRRRIAPRGAGPNPSGYDARSVLVLAIVVGLFAALVGWAMTLTREPSPQLQVPAPATSSGETVQGPAAPRTAAAEDHTDAPAPPRGVQLAPGRITGTRAASGGGILRIAVSNSGSEPLDSSSGVEVSALVNGALVGPTPLGAVDAGGQAAVELYLDTCPSGRAAVVATVDPRNVQREADERDNARSTTVAFDC